MDFGLLKCTAVSFLLLCMTAVVFLTYSWDFSILPLGLWKTRFYSVQKSLKEDDPWFSELVKASPKPFSTDGEGLSAEEFIWWEGVQGERCNLTFYNRTMKSLFQVIPPVPEINGLDLKHSRSCAVVGNSGNLKESHYGPLIDSHDMIIRINHGITRGFEADVGEKTTHHVMYPESAVKLNNSTHLMFFPFKISDLLWLHKQVSSRKQVIANKNLVTILNPSFMKFVHEVWLKKKGKYPSTGFLVVALSLKICDKVSVFGFGADRDGNWSHYFEKLRNKKLKTGPHNGTCELEVIQQLEKRKKLSFF